MTNATWPKGKLVVLLEEHLPTLSTTAKKQQQTAGSSQPAIEGPSHVHVEPQHVFSGPSRSLFQQQEEVEAFYQQQANAFYQQQANAFYQQQAKSSQCITQRAMRRK